MPRSLSVYKLSEQQASLLPDLCAEVVKLRLFCIYLTVLGISFGQGVVHHLPDLAQRMPAGDARLRIGIVQQ